MLVELAIENLGVIAAAHLPFAPGFTALTGETGAGKTMILNALTLIRGGKSDPAWIRHTSGGAPLAIESRWEAQNFPDALAILSEAGGRLDDDGEAIAVRVVTKNRSKAHLGGRSVPAGVLAEFTRDLVTIHGQADQIRLRTPTQQRQAVDVFAGESHLGRLTQLSDAWRLRTELDSRLEKLVGELEARHQERDLLAAQLAVIEAVGPQPNEFDELTATANRLTNAESLRLAVTAATAVLNGDDTDLEQPTAVELVESVRRNLLAALAADPTLEPLVERAAELGFLISDLAGDLSAYLSDLDVEPDALEQAQSRLGELNKLIRAHGAPIEQILDWAENASLRLLELDSDGDTVSRLEVELAELDSRLSELAGAVTAGRQQAASELAEAVTQELNGLGMGGSVLTVSVTQRELRATGADHITFELIAHPGAPARPVSKGASGGELSRLMLAIELTLAARRSGPLPTFVFDEVDAGVGGHAAVEVGRRLARLAASTQVIVVTHLAQVAAFADGHLVVTKHDGETTVTQVTGSEREREIARMLSGSSTSETALRHAQELLAASTAGNRM
ncbi:MAG: DNA repair protein RecN [Promicromonosporaceae bacterium]|nr:DNA repair protein RecN [Promicromonosporaceae bacterium]